MSLFGNPIDGPMSLRQKAGLALYFLLAFISIWATSESLYDSFNFPIVISYVIGAGIVFILAALLTAFVNAFDERKLFAVIFLAIVFLIVWAISLATNSHKFFTQLKLDDIRTQEMKTAYNELKNLETNSRAIGNKVINDYQMAVTNRISAYESEVANDKNFGHGEKANELKIEVENSMPGTKFDLLTGYKNNQSDARKLAAAMGKIMTGELNKRIASMKALLNGNDACGEDGKNENLRKQLDSCDPYYLSEDKLLCKTILSEAHQYYNELYACMEKKLVEELGWKPPAGVNSFPKALEMPVPSIKLEKISALIPYVQKHPEHRDSFWLSIAIAFAIDLASFAIFYFMVLKKDDNY